MSWRFYPTNDTNDDGFLVRDSGEASRAFFLSPKQLKALHQRKGVA